MLAVAVRSLFRSASRGLFLGCLLAAAPVLAQEGLSDDPIPEVPAAEAESRLTPSTPVPPPLDDEAPFAEVAAQPADVPVTAAPMDAGEPEFRSDSGLKPISNVKINITPTRGDLPADHAGPRFAEETTDLRWPGVYRPWGITPYCWDAPGSRHFTLFFEETSLERYGWHWGCLQPVVSAGHFFGSAPLIPYKAAVRPYCCPTFTLGHYRPGNCVPYQCHMLPLDARAAAVQAGAVVGGIYLFP
jgi:hypothetical protein